LNERNRLAGNKLSLRVQKGMKLPNKEDISKIKKLFKEDDDDFVLNFKPDYSVLYKDGGEIQKKESKTRSLEELIQYAKEQNPRFV
jgi:hypothetical protein